MKERKNKYLGRETYVNVYSLYVILLIEDILSKHYKARL